jgi:hypothetical protein
MAMFVLSAALAFVLYEALAFARWPVPQKRFTIGSFALVFTRDTAAWGRRVMRGVLIAGVLVSVLFLHDVVFPTDTISRNKANIVLGFMFGPMLAIWINSVLRHRGDRPLTKGQMVGGVGLIVFFVVGSVGNETGRLIEQLARNISSLKVLGSEFQFIRHEAPAGSGSSPPAGSQQAGIIWSSNGLYYLTVLDKSIIGRDRDYLALFGKLDDKLMSQLPQAQEFARRVVVPPSSCLYGWLSRTADERSVTSYLADFADVFRQIDALDDNGRTTQVANAILRISADLASDVLEFARVGDVITECAALVEEFCPGLGDKAAKSKEDLQGALGCIRKAQKQLEDDPEKDIGGSPISSCAAYDLGPQLPKPRDLLLCENAMHLQRFTREQGADLRPYFAIGHASLMAQLGQYEAAEAILFRWIESKKRPPNRSGSDKWFDIRVRSIAAAFLEEWIVRDGTKIRTSVRNEHLENLDALRDELRVRLSASPFFFQRLQRKDSNAPLVLSKPVPAGCGFQPTDEEAKAFSRYGPWNAKKDTPLEVVRLLRMAMFASYISIELGYLRNTLDHPEYEKKYAETTSSDLKWLAQIDLSCLPAEDPVQADAAYGEVLEAFSRSALQYGAMTNPPTLESASKARYEDALRAVNTGLAVLHGVRPLVPGHASEDFLTRIALSYPVTVKEMLEQDQKLLQRRLRAE